MMESVNSELNLNDNSLKNKEIAMTATEKKYIITRLDDIARHHENNIKHVIIKKEKTITYKELWSLIMDGKLKPRTTAHVNSEIIFATKEKDNHLYLAFNIDKYVSRPKYKLDYNDTRIKIYKECTRIKDEIMLGSSKEGLKLIKVFQKKKF